jgi:hypothetical protein
LVQQRIGSRSLGPKKSNAAGPATRPHSYVVSCAARSPRGGGMTASAPQRSRSHEQRVPRLPKRVAHSQSHDHELASLRWPAVRPVRARRATNRVGEEAAMPGQPAALARVFWNVPRRFTLENHQAAAGSAAIIRQAQETSRFAAPTLR